MAVNRITGMVSGMDTDKLVKDLMKVEKMRIDNTDKQKQKMEWKQEIYRDVIGSIRGFQNKFFDVLKPENNFRSSSAFSKFSESVKVNGANVSYVSAKGSAAISKFEHTIQSVSQLATRDTWETTKRGLNNVTSAELFSGSAIPAQMEFTLSIDNTAKTISLDTAGITNVDQLKDALNGKIQEAFGVSGGSDYANLVTADASKKTIKIGMAGSEVSVLEVDGHKDDLTWLGISSGASSSDYDKKNIGELLGVSTADLSSMTINGVALSDMGLTETSTLSEVSKAISQNEKIGVELGYTSASDTFSIRSKNTGTAHKIEMSDAFKNAFGFDAAATHKEAKNAILTLDGTQIIKESNNFLLDGISYGLNQTYDGSQGDIDIKVEKNVGAIKEKIMNFVKDYNEMVGKINVLLKEKKERSFEPLTKDEREAMSEEEIEKWEKKAKSGLVRGDRDLESMLSRMRSALYESVDGVDMRVFDMGIQTTSNYKDKAGQLVINEDKLEEAITNNYDKVVRLFTNESDKRYTDDANKEERYKENGLANRIHDILQDAVRTKRNLTTGRKGSLLEKAGVKGDISEFKNEMSEKMRAHKEKIARLWDMYYKKENQYYTMFAKMETALKRMQNQGMSFMSQMG